jgi:microcystin-dependent protein
LTIQELPAHNHRVKAKNATADETLAGTTPGPTVALAQGAASTTPVTQVDMYGTLPVNTGGTFAPGAISNTGNNQPHPNQQPYLVLNFCLAMQGIFPSRN